MFECIASPYLVPFDGSFAIKRSKTSPRASETAKAGKAEFQKKVKNLVEEMSDLQRILYAHDRRAVLLIFQAMDAAGKDSTIRAVMSGINPMGCQVFSFKQPSAEELDHDFLWRTTRCLPERGRIGIFNRSYYEEVLVVRVHPEYLERQKLPEPVGQDLWEERYQSIRDFEKHMARNGTVILKFWLNVSKEEQRRRFLERIAVPKKNWKFSPSDVDERRHWDEYMGAYEQALNATSRPWAPWYAIPADDKPYMHYTVAKILVENLKRLGLSYPSLDDNQRGKIQVMKEMLESEER